MKTERCGRGSRLDRGGGSPKRSFESGNSIRVSIKTTE